MAGGEPPLLMALDFAETVDPATFNPTFVTIQNARSASQVQLHFGVFDWNLCDQGSASNSHRECR
eukprot:m.302071 g.302071  ORF g.302071 m.302071 type:complete len:65 (+) comp55229_c1_seq3:148-342(+)